jgi:hypothetical protein
LFSIYTYYFAESDPVVSGTQYQSNIGLDNNSGVQLSSPSPLPSDHSMSIDERLQKDYDNFPEEIRLASLRPKVVNDPVAPLVETTTRPVETTAEPIVTTEVSEIGDEIISIKSESQTVSLTSNLPESFNDNQESKTEEHSVVNLSPKDEPDSQGIQSLSDVLRKSV